MRRAQDIGRSRSRFLEWRVGRNGRALNAGSEELKPAMQELNRRNFVLRGAAITATALVVGSPLAQDTAQGWEESVKKILGDTKATDGRVTFDMPEIAENGNTVPFSISVESPMTDSNYIKAIHVISTGNPQPGVATFRLTPQSGKAAVASRMRLARTQDVIVLAELSDGKFWQSRRSVKVTIGGCGG
jgi:sulfur-oxidizing protein SoxY